MAGSVVYLGMTFDSFDIDTKAETLNEDALGELPEVEVTDSDMDRLEQDLLDGYFE